MKRREFISLVGGAVAAWPLVARAQQSNTQLGDNWSTVLGKINSNFSELYATTPIATTTIVLDSDTSIYKTPDGFISVGDNPYIGAGTRGVTFTETIEVVTADFPNNVLMAWSWPNQSGPFDFGIRAYPLFKVYPQPNQAVNLYNNIVTSFDYTVQGELTLAVLHEAWLGIPPPYNTLEVEVFLQQPQSLNLRNAQWPFISIQTPAPYNETYDVSVFFSDCKHLLIYPTKYVGVAVTNSFGSNPTLSGSVNGSPGTDPTNCSFTSGPNGLTKTIVGSGTATAADGTTVNYVDVHFTGTPGSSGNINFKIETEGLPSPPFQQWFMSTYLALVGGSLTNVGAIALNFNGYGATFLENFGTTGSGVNSYLTSTLQRFGLQAKLARYSPPYGYSTIIYPQILVAVTSGNAVNFTLRIASPMFVPDSENLHPNYHYTRTITSAKFNWLVLFNALIAAGFMTGTELLTSIQLGPEIVSGQGSMYIRKFSAIVD
jgi:hypothetical protein